MVTRDFRASASYLSGHKLLSRYRKSTRHTTREWKYLKNNLCGSGAALLFDTLWPQTPRFPQSKHRMWCFHHLQAQCDLPLTTSICHWCGETAMADRKADGHVPTRWALHPLLTQQERSFPTQAWKTKHVLTTVLLHDNREVYVILCRCNQKISTPPNVSVQPPQSMKHGGMTEQPL